MLSKIGVKVVDFSDRGAFAGVEVLVDGFNMN